MSPAGKGRSGFINTQGDRVMDSAPPAMTISASPVSMLREAIMVASRLEPQSRLTVVAGTLTGSPASRLAIRPRFRLSSPAPFALPKITSSTAAPSSLGVAFEQSTDRVRGEIVRPDSSERAVEAAERGAHGVVQVGGHDHPLSRRRVSRCGRTCRGTGQPDPCRHGRCHR